MPIEPQEEVEVEESTELQKVEPKKHKSADLTSAEFVEPQAANAPIFVSLKVPGEFILQVNQDAGILNPPIELPENGDAFLDEQNLQDKAKEMVRFVNKASEQYKFDRKELIWVGYSNGANMISSIMLFYPTVIQKAVLLRPNSSISPKPLPVFADVFTLISAGRQDETVPLENTEKLIRTFQHCGAVVELFQHDANHDLTESDIVAVQKWMMRQHK